jgi:hypothetical protein
MRTEVSKLLEQGVVEPCSPGEADLVNPIFSIPKKDGSQRLIFNGRAHLNDKLISRRFRLPTFEDVRSRILQGAYAVTCDIKSAFLHTPLDHAAKRLCAFKMGRTLYRWKALPFGAKLSPALHCTLLQMCVDHISRVRGLAVTMYVDDGLLVAASREEALRAQRLFLRDLSDFGWTINQEKSFDKPSTIVEFLGLVWDLRAKHVRLPSAKVVRTRSELRRTARACATGRLHLAQIRRAVGLVESAKKAVRQAHIQLSRPLRLLRRMAKDREAALFGVRRPRKRRAFRSNAERRRDVRAAGAALARVADKLKEWNGRDLRPLPLLARISTDASDHGLGGSILWESQRADVGACRLPCKLSFPVPFEMSPRTIAEKELYAATYMVRRWVFDRGWSDGRLHIYIDNTVALSYLSRPTGRVPRLEDLVLPLAQLLAERNLAISVEYVRSADNVTADALSRVPTALAAARLLSWALRKLLVALALPPLALDLFATPWDTHGRHYASPVLGPGAVALDGLQVELSTWSGQGSILVFPPPRILARVVTHLLHARASAVLVIVPFWPRREWALPLLRAASHVVLLPRDAVLLPDPHQGRAASGRARREVRWLAVKLWSPSSGGRESTSRRCAPSSAVSPNAPIPVTTLSGASGSGLRHDEQLIRAVRRFVTS